MLAPPIIRRNLCKNCPKFRPKAHLQMNGFAHPRRESLEPPKDIVKVLSSCHQTLSRIGRHHSIISRQVSVCVLAHEYKTIMLFFHILTLMLQITPLPHSAVVKPFSDHARVVLPCDTQTHPKNQSERRALVYGLPPEWTAVFQTVSSIQPPLINPAFIEFFSTAAKLAAADPVPGRRVQRIPFGALVLEFIASDEQNQLVTKEFVEAASLWLLDAAQKGWTGLFKAWVMDRVDGDVVFIRLTSLWDEMMSLSF